VSKEVLNMETVGEVHPWDCPRCKSKIAVCIRDGVITRTKIIPSDEPQVIDYNRPEKRYDNGTKSVEVECACGIVYRLTVPEEEN